MKIVELDPKGRVLLPASLPKSLGTRRFRVRIVREHIEPIPLRDAKALKGKYRNRLKTPWARLEERAESSVKGRDD